MVVAIFKCCKENVPLAIFHACARHSVVLMKAQGECMRRKLQTCNGDSPATQFTGWAGRI